MKIARQVGRLFRVWNVFVSEKGLKVFKRPHTKSKRKETGGIFDVHGVCVIISLEKGKESVEDSIIVLTSIFDLIKKHDLAMYLRVKRHIRCIGISDSFKVPSRYNVYARALYLNVPFPGYASDPIWVIGSWACYFVEQATFGKIFWSRDVLFNKSEHDRVSQIVYQKGKQFGRKLGEPWVSMYTKGTRERGRIYFDKSVVRQ